MEKIIVTDLTHFNDEEILCAAGISLTSGRCIRPLPYLSAARCIELQVHPGAIFKANFMPSQGKEAPHIEDMTYTDLSLCKKCSSTQFYEVLEESAYESIEEGFEVELECPQKCVGLELAPVRSLITVRVEPKMIQVFHDKYKNGRIQLHLQETSGKKYSFLPINDFGVFRYTSTHYEEAGFLNTINGHLKAQDEIFFVLV
jgi:hypothetical protein